MKAGDAFYIRDRSVDTHLWVVISDPQRDPRRVTIMSAALGVQGALGASPTYPRRRTVLHRLRGAVQ